MAEETSQFDLKRNLFDVHVWIHKILLPCLGFNALISTSEIRHEELVFSLYDYSLPQSLILALTLSTVTLCRKQRCVKKQNYGKMRINHDVFVLSFTTVLSGVEGLDSDFPPSLLSLVSLVLGRQKRKSACSLFPPFPVSQLPSWCHYKWVKELTPKHGCFDTINAPVGLRYISG